MRIWSAIRLKSIFNNAAGVIAGKKMEEFTRSVIEIIKQIPKGRVTTYGRISLMAGRSRGARQVSRILHTMSRKYNLPWHRVINIKGTISLPEYGGYYEQKARLLSEGIEFDEKDRVDLKTFLWNPGDIEC